MKLSPSGGITIACKVLWHLEWPDGSNLGMNRSLDEAANKVFQGWKSCGAWLTEQLTSQPPQNMTLRGTVLVILYFRTPPEHSMIGTSRCPGTCSLYRWLLCRPVASPEWGRELQRLKYESVFKPFILRLSCVVGHIHARRVAIHECLNACSFGVKYSELSKLTSGCQYPTDALQGHLRA